LDYIPVIMQTHPRRFTTLALTVIGLGLLITAIILNHYHPRNAGVAAASHGYIAALTLNTRPSVAYAGSTIVATTSPVVRNLAETRATFDSDPSVKSDKASVEIKETPTNRLAKVEEQCPKLGNESSKQTAKVVDEDDGSSQSCQPLQQQPIAQPH
jgi:hypothetical protein